MGGVLPVTGVGPGSREGVLGSMPYVNSFLGACFRIEVFEEQSIEEFVRDEWKLVDKKLARQYNTPIRRS